MLEANCNPDICPTASFGAFLKAHEEMKPSEPMDFWQFLMFIIQEAHSRKKI
jgi:hypothetical protein